MLLDMLNVDVTGQSVLAFMPESIEFAYYAILGSIGSLIVWRVG